MSGEKPYQYTADDIRRYREGLMNASEMHAMERAALDDAFLADAMEGLGQHTPAAIATDMDQLTQRLRQRVTPAKVIPMKPQRPWMAIAASAVILVGLGMTLLYTNPEPEVKTIARVEPAKAELPAAAPAADTAETQAAAEVAATPALSAPQQKKRELSGSVARVEVKDLEDSTRNTIASAPEAQEKPSPLTADAGKAKIDDKASLKRARSVAPPPVPLNEKEKKDNNTGRVYTEPEDGWSAWEVYVLHNLRKPRDPVIHGNVVVSFTVNPETGKPYDLKIDKGLHYLYDKEAIRLIKEGPSWSVYNTDGPVKTTLTVVF